MPTVNVPVTLPPETVQVGTGDAATRVPLPVIVQVAPSAKLNPVPVTPTDVPLGPEEGDRVTTCGNTVSVAETCTGVVSLTVTV